MTPEQAQIELIAWMEKTLEHLDREAEGNIIVHDPSALYAEGIVCFRRLSAQSATRAET